VRVADSDWLLAGFVIGLLVGIPLGFIIAQIFKPSGSASVVFERDREGRITGIHYVPVGGRG